MRKVSIKAHSLERKQVFSIIIHVIIFFS